jgi:hypothetical protein
VRAEEGNLFGLLRWWGEGSPSLGRRRSPLGRSGGGRSTTARYAPATAALIQSNFGPPGQLDIVSQMIALLDGPVEIRADRASISNVRGTPALIQSTFGTNGNFEMMVIQQDRVAHYWRDNDQADSPWHGPTLLPPPSDHVHRAGGGTTRYA